MCDSAVHNWNVSGCANVSARAGQTFSTEGQGEDFIATEGRILV